MPPRPKLTKEKVIKAAYDITKEKGISYLSGRTLAKQLNTTTTPIFTLFSTMDEIKNEVYNIVIKEIKGYFKDLCEDEIVYKEFGLRWVKYAVENHHLYGMIFLMNEDSKPKNRIIEFYEITDPVVNMIKSKYELSDLDAKKVINHMIVYSTGLSTLINSGHEKYDEKRIIKLLSISFYGFLLVYKADGVKQLSTEELSLVVSETIKKIMGIEKHD